MKAFSVLMAEFTFLAKVFYYLNCIIHYLLSAHIKKTLLFVVDSHLALSDSLRPYRLQPARLFCPWTFPGRNTGAGGRFLFQGMLPTQGSKSRLLPLLLWQTDSLPLHRLGNFPENISNFNRKKRYTLILGLNEWYFRAVINL